jgi:hypothetical protein
MEFGEETDRQYACIHIGLQFTHYIPDVGIDCFLFGRSRVKISTQILGILIEDFRGFPPTLQRG